MTQLLPVLAVVAIFALLLAHESRQDGSQRAIRPLGLLAWLLSGNWPAKVGAGLLTLGMGALLRYALINFELPPELKLGGGFVIAALLGAAATALKTRPDRRAIHLALAGAAFGVAYLTAYAAYDYFHFISSVNALALLALVSVAAGLFSVSSNAMSVAILAMVGAYVAPKFAIDSPGPLPVYGYYVAISSLSFAMVAMRGWRALIHLSFLFTLTGALFFGWSGKFYEAQHHAVMFPLLLLLAALHLAMPLVERRHVSRATTARMDQGYFVALPLVAALLMLKIAPRIAVEGAQGLGALALLWAAAAGILAALGRGQVLRHVFVAGLLACGAAVCVVQHVPWLLVGVVLAVAALAAAPRLGWSGATQALLCRAILLLGVLHVVTSILQPAPLRVFLNEVFMERLFVGSLLGAAAWMAERRSIPTARLLGVTTAVWIALATLSELLRLRLDFAAQLVYALLLVLLVAQAIAARKLSFSPTPGALLLLALVGTCHWAANGVGLGAGVVFLMLTAAALVLVVAVGDATESDEQTSITSPMALALLPFVLVPWAIAISDDLDAPVYFFAATVAGFGLFLALISARVWVPGSRRWNDLIWPTHFLAATCTLSYLVVFHIERGVWPVAVELLTLAYLILFVAVRAGPQEGRRAGAVVVVATALVIQAMLLRAWGPDRVMNAADIVRMALPAVVSLMWAVLGAGLAWWGARAKSVSVWTMGAVLLALAALKLIFWDFGTLDQLGNIFALIGAGVVFMAVAWFAPIPKGEARPKEPPPATSDFSDTHPAALSPAGGGEAAAPASPSKVAANAPPINRASAIARPKNKEGGIDWLLVMVAVLAIGAVSVAFEWRKYSKRQQVLKEKLEQLALAPVDDSKTSTAPMPSAPSTAPNYVASPPPPAIAQPVRVMDACTQFSSQVPADAVLYAGGAYSGRKLGYQIDQSGHEATQFDVFVNEPGRKVVLALGAYEPSVWNIRWSPGTVVAAVLAAGYHRQRVAGVDDSVPKLESSYDGGAACGYFYFDSKDPHSADTVVRRVFGRSAQTYFQASNGRMTLGTPGLPESQYVQSSVNSVDSFRDASTSAAGQAGIEQLIREGKLRRATREDGIAWKQAWDKARNLPQINVVGASPSPDTRDFRFLRSYVVLQPMQYPAGLFGAHAVTFIVSLGVPRPLGNPGHSEVLDMNSP